MNRLGLPSMRQQSASLAPKLPCNHAGLPEYETSRLIFNRHERIATLSYLLESWCFRVLRNEGLGVASNRARHEAVMPRRAIPLIFSSVLLGLAGGIAIRAQSADQAPAVGQSSSAESADQLLAKGKEIFLERCARCHNDGGDKPLKTGLPLNEREPFQRRDRSSRERPPARSTGERTPRGYAIYFEFDAEQGLGERRSTETLVGMVCQGARRLSRNGFGSHSSAGDLLARCNCQLSLPSFAPLNSVFVTPAAHR